MAGNGAKRPAGVAIAAIVLGLMASIGMLGAALSIAGLFLTHYSIIPRIHTVRVGLVIFDLVVLGLVFWCFWTVIGLFQLKPWARRSILLIGALDFCFFAMQSVGLLVIRSRYDLSGLILPMGSSPHAGTIHVATILLGIAAIDATLALIGVWWLVYFSARRVRLVFGEAA